MPLPGCAKVKDKHDQENESVDEGKVMRIGNLEMSGGVPENFLSEDQTGVGQGSQSVRGGVMLLQVSALFDVIVDEMC